MFLYSIIPAEDRQMKDRRGGKKRNKQFPAKALDRGAAEEYNLHIQRKRREECRKGVSVCMQSEGGF